MATENILNTIATGTVLVGKITTKGDIRIEGKVIGTVNCDSKLVIGKNGSVEGNVDARNAYIEGEVKGTVVIRELLQLQESGKINGDVFTTKLAVQIGALFTGNCRMGKDAIKVLETSQEKVEDTLRNEKEKQGAINGSEVKRKENIPLRQDSNLSNFIDERKEAQA